MTTLAGSTLITVAPLGRMTNVPSLWDREHWDQVRRRLDRFERRTAPLCRQLRAQGMLSYVGDSLRMALGEIQAPKVRTFLRYPPLKWLAIYMLPLPTKVEGLDAYLTASLTDWDEDRSHLEDLIERCRQRRINDVWGDHPFLGHLSKHQWGLLSYQQIDHHLRQFRC